jgi:putative peptidoglycan lipid II flippase
VLIKAIVPGFFARQDTATPVKIAVVAVVVNIGLAVTLMQVLAHAGIALATALSAWLNAFALGIVLIRRGHFRVDAQLMSRSPKVVLCAGIMAAGLWFGAGQMKEAFANTEVIRAVSLTLLVVGGLILFFGCAQLTGAMRFADLRRALKRS